MQIGDVVLLFKTGIPSDYAHSMIVHEPEVDCLFDSKLGEGHLVRTGIAPILREYDGLFNAAVVVRRRHGTGPGSGSFPGASPESRKIQWPSSSNNGETATQSNNCNVIPFDSEQGYNLGATLPWCNYSASLLPGEANNSGQMYVHAKTLTGVEASIGIANIAGGDTSLIKMNKIKAAFEPAHPNWRADIAEGCDEPGQECIGFRYQHQTADRSWEPAAQISVHDNTSGAVKLSVDSEDTSGSFAVEYALNLAGAPATQDSEASLSVPLGAPSVPVQEGQNTAEVVQNLCPYLEHYVYSFVCSGSSLQFQTSGGEMSFMAYWGPSEFFINMAQADYCGMECPQR